jgi:hypothetical protein
MNEQALILERSIQNDLQAVAAIYQKIGGAVIIADATENELIVLAYYLHNLYVACENIFLRIAEVFENQVDDKAGWHVQLLLRMTLNLMPIRPAVIDGATYKELDELRRFRHLFRSAYQMNIDPQRLQLVLNSAWKLKEQFTAQVEYFLDFVRTLNDS